jgi:hypothetical protein
MGFPFGIFMLKHGKKSSNYGHATFNGHARQDDWSRYYRCAWGVDNKYDSLATSAAETGYGGGGGAAAVATSAIQTIIITDRNCPPALTTCTACTAQGILNVRAGTTISSSTTVLGTTTATANCCRVPIARATQSAACTTKIVAAVAT